MTLRQVLTLLIAMAMALPLKGGELLADYVDTRVGTASSQTQAAGLFGKGSEEYGQTIPAVLEPYGMNFWTPQTRDTERKCVAPYYYADSLLQGFRNSHWIVGGCTQDYGSMTLMPLSGSLRCRPETRATRYSHDDETAKPYYYSTYLPDEGIKAEMTGTSRTAIFRFTYDQGGKAYIVVNPNSDEGEGFIAIDTVANTIYGYNPVHRIYQSKGRRAGFSGHFVVQFDRPIRAYGCSVGESVMPGVASIGDEKGIGCYVEYDVRPGECVMVKASSSFTGHDGALRNMESEMPDWDFDRAKQELSQTWEDWLGRVRVEGETVQMEKFYGALYRSSFLPHEVSDADGSYCTFASGYPVRQMEGGRDYYDDYSMWDTYRAQHPLITLLNPELSGDMMQSLVVKAEQGGWLPIFPCWNSYTAAMIGDHCIAAISDAYCKGVRNFDADKAYAYMLKNACEMPTTEEYLQGKGRRALMSYLQYGYIPVEDSVPDAYHKREQTSRTLEYAYDDFALAQMAKALGHEQDYTVLMDRSKNYRNVINPATGYADGRHADGRYCGDAPIAFSKHITEGAPCHYTWYVPHDPEGLIEVMGGKKKYEAKLDTMFAERRYWHGNEPCHQVAYMYNYCGRPDKTSKAVRHIMETEYLNQPGGLSGNDDAGQMSAWYVFAALGFYPVCPSTPRYEISGPTFTKAVLTLGNGKQATLLAPKASDKNVCVKGIKRNGKKYPHRYILHDDLMQGGVWEFDMGPSKTEK